MKITTKLSHYWFVIISVLSFLVGWGMLAHSLKPIPVSQATTLNIVSLPTLPPIQAFNAGSWNGSGLNYVAPSTRSNTGSPILRSGGS